MVIQLCSRTDETKMGTVCRSAHVRLSRNYVTKKVTVNKKASIQGVIALWADHRDINTDQVP